MYTQGIDIAFTLLCAFVFYMCSFSLMWCRMACVRLSDIAKPTDGEYRYGYNNENVYLEISIVSYLFEYILATVQMCHIM